MFRLPEETQMTQPDEPIDEETVADEDLPTETDPSQVPPDEGDAGQ